MKKFLGEKIRTELPQLYFETLNDCSLLQMSWFFKIWLLGFFCQNEWECWKLIYFTYCEECGSLGAGPLALVTLSFVNWKLDAVFCRTDFTSAIVFISLSSILGGLYFSFAEFKKSKSAELMNVVELDVGFTS